MTVVVKRIGGSVAVVIPKSVAQEMELTHGTALDVSTSAGALVMHKQGRRPRRSLQRIVARINSQSYRRQSRRFQNDSAVGKEIW